MKAEKFNGLPKGEISLDYETIIVGAGISGIGTAIQLKKHDMGSFCLLEQSDRLGGTWRDNTYPGVAVDIPSLAYSFSFEPNPNWSQLFAPGAEILDYVNHCADKYGIRPFIRFNSSVKEIRFDPSLHYWTIVLTDESILTARFVISATGILNQPIKPDIDGIDTFKGKMMHSARWNHDYDIQNKKVGLIGTGASAVQIVPSIANKVQQLTVFQRTPIWVAPKMNIKFPKWNHFIFKYIPFAQRLARLAISAGLEVGTFVTVQYKKLPFLTRGAEGNLVKFLRSQVKDPELRKKLTPNYGFGCKRPAISNQYWKSFNKKNVTLETETIKRITHNGIITADGKEHQFDVIILGTGFKTQEVGNAPSFKVFGIDNLELGQFWEDHRYQAYDGISVPKFPNFFLTFGPYTGGLNWFSMLEAHVKYIVRCLQKAKKQGATLVEVKQEANERYFQAMLKLSENTVFKNAGCQQANSYYFDAHGDASLPSPVVPITRWLRVRRTKFTSYIFQ